MKGEERSMPIRFIGIRIDWTCCASQRRAPERGSATRSICEMSANRIRMERSWVWRNPLVLGLTIAMPRLFVPSASAVPPTGVAIVTIAKAEWSSAGCPTATASPRTIPKLTRPCDEITAEALAGAYQICGGHAQIPGDCSIDIGNTGCEVDTIEASPGHKKYRIYNPKRSGKVTVVATVTGQCYDCTAATWTATGIVEVHLEDMDD